MHPHTQFNRRYDLIRVLAGNTPFKGYLPKAKPRGIRLASDPEAIPAHRMPYAGELKRSLNRMRSSVFGLDLRQSKTGAEWTKIPDPKALRSSAHKRRRGKHLLVWIAEQLPGKLPVIVNIGSKLPLVTPQKQTRVSEISL